MTVQEAAAVFGEPETMADAKRIVRLVWRDNLRAEGLHADVKRLDAAELRRTRRKQRNLTQKATR